MQDQLNKKFSSFSDSKNYKGYLQSEEPKIDSVLAHIGPGSPCGEFFRRYWHPVSLSSEDVSYTHLTLPTILIV